MKGMNSVFFGRVERAQEVMGSAMRHSGLPNASPSPVPTPRRHVTQDWRPMPRRTEVVVYARSLKEAFGPDFQTAHA